MSREKGSHRQRIILAGLLLGVSLSLSLPGPGSVRAGSGVLIGLPIDAATAAVNGKPVSLDSPAIIRGSRTLVPVRFVSERLGATVEWNADTAQVTVSLGGHVLVLTIGQRQALFDGAVISSDAPPVIVGGRTLVPLRLVAERLGAHVGWEKAHRTVWIAVGHPPGYVLALPDSYDPRDITVPPGTAVVFINGDKEEHTVTDFDADAYDLNLEVGEAVTVTYTEPGIHRYWCVVHDQMDGSVTVAPPGPWPPGRSLPAGGESAWYSLLYRSS